MMVSMKNDAGLVRHVKVGFCWTAFFFGALPFFFRGMPGTGFLWCCTFIIGNFVLPFKMNKYTAQYYLEHGYKPFGKGWHKAAMAWGVAVPSTGEGSTNEAFSDEPESSKYKFKIWHAIAAIIFGPMIIMGIAEHNGYKPPKINTEPTAAKTTLDEPVSIPTPVAVNQTAPTPEVSPPTTALAKPDNPPDVPLPSPVAVNDASPAALPTNAPPVTPSFDCVKASNGPERMICSSAVLSEADMKLNQVYKTALHGASDNGTALKKRQNVWRKTERDVCADESCLLNAYQKRIAELQS